MSHPPFKRNPSLTTEEQLRGYDERIKRVLEKELTPIGLKSKRALISIVIDLLQKEGKLRNRKEDGLEFSPEAAVNRIRSAISYEEALNQKKKEEAEKKLSQIKTFEA